MHDGTSTIQYGESLIMHDGTSTIQYGESLVMHVGIYHTIWRISGNACGSSTIQYGESSLVMYVGHLPYNMENL